MQKSRPLEVGKGGEGELDETRGLETAHNILDRSRCEIVGWTPPIFRDRLPA